MIFITLGSLFMMMYFIRIAEKARNQTICKPILTKSILQSPLRLCIMRRNLSE